MSSLQARTALVTGSSGFLGGHIVNKLAANGWIVTGLGRGDAALGSSGHVSSHIQAELPGPELRSALSESKPNLLVHAAGSASVPDSLSDPAYDFRHSVDALFCVLDAVRAASPETKVILLSSAAVYGNPPSLPVSEDAPASPLSPYGFHKLICEELMTEFHQVYGVATASARIFSAYGPGLARQVLWDICEKATGGGDGAAPDHIELFGTGSESRDFIHAEDVANGVYVIAEGSGFDGASYNLASGMETSIRDVAAELIRLIAGRIGADGPELRFTGAGRAGDPARWRADISAMSRLGFEPAVGLHDGLSSYVEWYLGRSRSPESRDSESRDLKAHS